MKKILFYTLSFFTLTTITTKAQVATSSQLMTVNSKKATIVPYSIDDPGEQFPVIWGLDTAWPDEWNMRRGTAFIGAENLEVARVSFQPSDLIINGELSNAQKKALDKRLSFVRMSGVTRLVLNCDHEVLMTPENATETQKAQYEQHRKNYVGKPEEWVKLFEATARYCQNQGFTIVSVSPFNEPDYGWNQGTRTDFYHIIELMKKNPFFDNIRISGGNTLNSDQALPWYNALKDYLDEGNTHQLAGSFDNYAAFFETVQADGKHGTADELHNVMEAMVGVEYGMQTGIWWGFDGLARGEFCRASNNGDRLAYAENRPTWTAASVYRNNKENKVQAFLGTSERQANDASYRFISRDRDVYYDGYGPVRDFVVDMPGGTGYQQGQTNAERVINITWGEDVQPYIKGNYVIQNKNGRVLSLGAATSGAGSNTLQKIHVKKANYQQWSVEPVSARIGGDFSYFSIRPLCNTGLSLDVLNSSLENDANIIVYHSNNGAQQQWYLQYAGDGYFYIRSRQSTLCLKAGTGNNTPIKQTRFTGEDNQKWRFVPAGLESETEAPSVPEGLIATSLSASIRLDWVANSESDILGYTILRAEVPETGNDTVYNTIARGITNNAFLDNRVLKGVEYLYKIKAQDQTGNTSTASPAIKASAINEPRMVAQWQFDNDLTDLSENKLHGANDGSVLTYTPIKKSGSRSIMFNGTNQFVQLPHEIASSPELSICTWVRWSIGDAGQHIFDFGNGTNQYMYLTPNGHGQMRFVMKNDGVEEVLATTKLAANTWKHITITIGAETVTLFVDGKQVAQSTEMKIRPNDIRPMMNYIGRSQHYNDPFFKGYIDDFRIYNYVLSAEEIVAVTEDLVNKTDDNIASPATIVTTEYYNLNGILLNSPKKGLNLQKHILSDGSIRIEKVIIQ